MAAEGHVTAKGTHMSKRSIRSAVFCYVESIDRFGELWGTVIDIQNSDCYVGRAVRGKFPITDIYYQCVRVHPLSVQGTYEYDCSIFLNGETPIFITSMNRIS